MHITDTFTQLCVCVMHIYMYTHTLINGHLTLLIVTSFRMHVLVIFHIYWIQYFSQLYGTTNSSSNGI